MIVFWLVLILMSLASWAVLFPQDALAIVVEMKRQLRLRVIRRTGTDGAKQLALDLHEFAAEEGFDPEMVDDVLVEHHGMIVERLGERGADEILGEADTTERYR